MILAMCLLLSACGASENSNNLRLITEAISKVPNPVKTDAGIIVNSSYFDKVETYVILREGSGDEKTKIISAKLPNGKSINDEWTQDDVD